MFCILFLTGGNAFAHGGIGTRVYAGGINYSLNPDNPFVCTATIALYFDISENIATDSMYIDWGDGNFNAVYATSITLDSSFHISQGLSLYKHIYTGTHTYASLPTAGYYIISPLFQYRLNYASNIIDGQLVDLRFYVQALVAIDTTTGFKNNSPAWEPLSPQIAHTHTSFSQPLSYNDTDGDSIVFELLPPLVNDNVAVPSYLFPNQFCQNIGQVSSLSISSAMDKVTWNSPCSQGIFALACVAKKYRNGRLLGSVMSDQNIYVSGVSSVENQLQSPFVKIYPNPSDSYINVEVTEPLSLVVYDLLGNSVLEQKFQTSGKINISNWSNGVYFIYDHLNNRITKFAKP